MRTSNFKYIVVTCLLSSVAFAAGEEAVEDDMMALLDSNVVSGASKTAEKADAAPATTSSISSADIKRFGITNLQEAINFFSLGLVAERTDDVQVGGRGIAFEPVGDNHVLVLIDGHLINDGRGGGVNFLGFGVPMESIDHIEFIVGPGSVLFGSYAMLGVINVITKDGKGANGLTLTVKGASSAAQERDGSLNSKVGTYGFTGRISGVAASEHVLLGRQLDWMVSGEYFLERLPARNVPGGVSTSGGVNLGDAYGRVRWGDFELRGKYARSKHSLPTEADSEVTDNTYNIEESFFADLVWRHDLSTRVSVQARGYFDISQYTVYGRWSTMGLARAFVPPEYNKPFADLRAVAYSRWGGGEAQVNVDWLGDGRFPLMAGVDGRAIYISNPERFLDPETGEVLSKANRIDKLEYVVAPYVQQRFRIGNVLEGNVGARLDTQSAAAPRLSPRAALVWTTPWQGKLKGVFSTAFRSPTASERFFQLPSIIALNPSLKPETVATGELSHEQRFGRQRLLVGGFFNHYDGLISYGVESGTGLQQQQNAGGFDNFGANGTFEGAFGSVHYALNVTGAHIASQTLYRMAPRVFGNAHISYEFTNGMVLSLVSSVYGPRVATNAITPLPASADFRGSVFFPKLGAGFNLRVSLGGSTSPTTALVMSSFGATGFDPAPVELSPNTQRLYVSFELGWSAPWPGSAQSTN